MIKDIIFDWGGVLAPPNNVIVANKLATKYQIDEQQLFLRMNSLEDDYSTSSASEGFYEKIHEEFGIPAAKLKKNLNSVPHDSVFEFAQSLSQKGYRVHILSNQMKPKTDSIRTDNELSFFSNTFFSNEIGLMKPSPDVFSYVLSELNKKPEECIFVDDEENNIIIATQQGFETILFKDLDTLKGVLLEKYGVKV